MSTALAGTGLAETDPPAASVSAPEGIDAAGVPAVLPAVAGGSVELGCEYRTDVVTITASTHLDPACEWTGRFEITASDVIFDCRGARLVGRSGRGIDIVAPVDVDMTGVVVRHCRMEGYLNSIRATRTGFRELQVGEEYAHELADVVIEHNELADSVGVGMYVDGYVSRVTIRGNRIERAGSTGIYLETGSRRNRVEHNVIHDNGYRENGPGGQVDDFGGLRFRWWGAGREGLAIDGSYENVVIGNDFAGNAHGGVMLYTNCGEFPATAAERYFDRRWPADRNSIEANRFTGGLNGVWVGQRMGENTLPMECAKSPYSTGPLRSITLDFAADNSVIGNHFDDVIYGIRVEDDGTTVQDNTFVSSTPGHHAVIIGTPERTTVLGRAVADTTLAGNHAEMAGNDDPYRWVHGFDGLTVTANTANGRSTGICEGEPPPRLGLIWVIEAAIEPVGAPVTPTPADLTHPVLGALPPCPELAKPVLIPGGDLVSEGTDETIRIPVTLSNPSDRTVTAEWKTPAVATPQWAGPGKDFAWSSGTVEFEPGQTDAEVEIALIDDAEHEDSELGFVSFHHPRNADLGGWWGLGLVLIDDDDRSVPLTRRPWPK